LKNLKLQNFFLNQILVLNLFFKKYSDLLKLFFVVLNFI